MTGGGFGGCTVTLAATDRVADIGERLAREYQRRHDRALTWFVSRPARGAHVVDDVGASSRRIGYSLDQSVGITKR